MKNKELKTGIMILSAVLGISGSYAVDKRSEAFNGATYYAISDGVGGFFWRPALPDHAAYVCTEGNSYCTIVTRGGKNRYRPQPNVVPNELEATPQNSVKSINKIADNSKQ